MTEEELRQEYLFEKLAGRLKRKIDADVKLPTFIEKIPGTEKYLIPVSMMGLFEEYCREETFEEWKARKEQE